MAANVGGSPFIKKEEELIGSNSTLVDNHSHSHSHEKSDESKNKRGISIAERRAAKCGFNVSSMNAARFDTAGLSPPPYFTVPPGLSPSALLDSPVMLPNAQAQLSPTTGTFQYPSPNHGENGIIPSVEPSNNIGMTMCENKELDYGIRDIERKGKEMMLEDGRQENNNGGKEVVMSSKNINAEDGYYWRKYGQKQVKGSDHPRSYYKCTHTSCPVTKKVERSPDGLVAEIIYKGHHNHPQPKLTTSPDPDHLLDATSSSILGDLPDTMFHLPTLSDHEVENRSPERVPLHEDLDDENEGKKRKRESERSGRECKLVVRIISDIDILDDGYRWRKYGQKVVKGNPNPRSYYKCTTPGCPVRKHVERAATDIKSVLTTYEGKHNHEPPSSKSGATNTTTTTTTSFDHVANLRPHHHAALTKPATDPRGGGKQQQQHHQHHQQQQQLIQENNLQPPMYLDRRNPILFNYNNLPPAASDLNFGPSSSSLYSLPFPPFHSLPYASSLPIKTTYPTSSNKLYPIYMPMPMPMQMQMPVQSSPSSPSPSPHINAEGPSNVSPPLASTFHDYSTRAVIPKQEEMRDEDELIYDTNCLSIPNQPNGTM